MILDRLENAGRYYDGGPLEKALKLLKSYTPALFESTPRSVIDGERMFANHAVYVTSPPEEGRMEAHRRYADVMLMLSGSEAIYRDETAELTGTVPYSEEKDVAFYALRPDATRLVLTPGSFVVLYPEDAHCPGRILRQAEEVRKVIVKILL